MPQSNFIVFPSLNMVASNNRRMSEIKLREWIKDSNNTPHVVRNARNELNWLWDSGLVGTIDTGIAIVDGYTLDSGPTWQNPITLLAGTAEAPLINHIYIFIQYDSAGFVKKSQIAVLGGDQTFPDNSYTGLLLWDIACSNTTVISATDMRRMDAFDGVYGHKHTGAPFDGPIVSFPASATVMGDTFLSLDPFEAETPIAIGLNEKGVANGVAPLDEDIKVPWINNYYMGPQGIYLLNDGVQNITFGSALGGAGWMITTDNTTHTSIQFSSMDMPATMYVYLLRSGGWWLLGDVFWLKEKPAQINWDVFPWTNLGPWNDFFPKHGWYDGPSLANAIRTLPYVANAYYTETASKQKMIVIIATSSAFQFGNAMQASAVLGGQHRGDVFHPTSPTGGAAGTIFLEHFNAADPKFPNTTVLGVGKGVEGSKVIIDAQTIEMTTGGDVGEFVSPFPIWRGLLGVIFGGKLMNAITLSVPASSIKPGGHTDALHIVDVNGDGKTYQLWTWRNGILVRIG